MKKSAVAVAVALALVMSTAAFAGWTKSGEGQATFRATGPAGFKMEGKTPTLDVKDDGTTITVTVGLEQLATGISLRDKHMRDKYLEVAKFPTTTLAVPVASLKLPAGAGVGEGDATGDYTLHGVTKPRSFHYKATCDAAGLCSVEGTMNLNMNEHGVVVPSYLGITVKPDLTVLATFPVKRP